MQKLFSLIAFLVLTAALVFMAPPIFASAGGIGGSTWTQQFKEISSK